MKISFCFCFNKKITGKKGEGKGEVLSDSPGWPHLHTSGLSELPWQWPKGSSSDKACKHTADSSQIQPCALGVCGLLKKKRKRKRRKRQRGKKGGGCTPKEKAKDFCTALELHNSNTRRAHLTSGFIFLLKKGWSRPPDSSKTNYSCLRLQLSTIIDHKRGSQCRRKVPGVSFSHPRGLKLDSLDEAHLLNWDVAEFNLQIQ